MLDTVLVAPVLDAAILHRFDDDLLRWLTKHHNAQDFQARRLEYRGEPVSVAPPEYVAGLMAVSRDEVVLGIIAPGGKVMAEASAGEETLPVAQGSLEAVLKEKARCDVGGHYSRPDVLQLHVNRA